MGAQEYHKLTWEDHATLCAELAGQVKAGGKEYHAIVAVSRGGLFPAGILATALNIRLVETISINGYDGETAKDTAAVLKPATLPSIPAERILIVDDLVDTGRTATILQQELPKADLAVVCAKPAGKPYATYAVQDIPQETWVCFPWE